jgi:hypothetical protein
MEHINRMDIDSLTFECQCCGDIYVIDIACTCLSCIKVYCKDCIDNHNCGTIDSTISIIGTETIQ